MPFKVLPVINDMGRTRLECNVTVGATPGVAAVEEHALLWVLHGAAAPLRLSSRLVWCCIPLS